MYVHFLQFFSLVTLSFLLAVPMPANAVNYTKMGFPKAKGAYDEGQARITATLLSESMQLKEGASFGLAVLLETDSKWHFYWKNPGDSGLATKITQQSPDVEFADFNWPVPEYIPDPSGQMVTYGYHGKTLLSAEAVLNPKRSDANKALVALEIKGLVCDIASCIPFTMELHKEFVVATQVKDAPKPVLELFEQSNTQYPLFHTVGTEKNKLRITPHSLRAGQAFQMNFSIHRCDFASAQQADEKCPRFFVPKKPAKQLFFPHQDNQIEIITAKLKTDDKQGSSLHVELRGRTKTQPAALPDNMLVTLAIGIGSHRGITLEIPLQWEPQDDEQNNQPSLTVKGSGLAAATHDAPVASIPEKSQLSLVYVLLLALLGGMILNLMPCVLPVLAMKVFGLARLYQESGKRRISHALMYTAGIVFSMALLAAVLIIFKKSGESVGWGFQFQHPVYIAAVSAIMLVFAMNLFGVFDISWLPGSQALRNAAQTSHHTSQSFIEGVLAVILATPCSAPFLATAVGFALASSALEIMLIFIFIGLGLALPFVLAAFIPKVAALMPRPGQWMVVFKELLGFALLATLVWLLWVFGRLSNADSMSELLMLLALLAFAVWLFGRAQKSKPSYARSIFRTLAAISLGISLAGMSQFELPKNESALEQDSSSADWERFSPLAVQKALEAGDPAFVVFTADWCLTCKANENVIIKSDAVTEAIELFGVKVFKADWTRKDAIIERELRRFGKGGVPMYLVYNPSKPDKPQLLPEILTIELLLEALERART